MVVVNLKEKDKVCYPFCQDLSNKELKLPNSPKKNQTDEQMANDPTLLDNQINIKWALFRLRQLPDMLGGPGGIKNTEIIIPGSYHIEKIKPGEWDTLLTKSEKYDVFVAPDDYYDDNCLFKAWRRPLTLDLPNEFKEQPHLYKHSTFQFAFLKNIIFSTNCQFLDIDENNKLQAVVDIYASPAGTYFIFQSGQIPFKWKLDVRQGIMTWNLTRDTIEAVKSTMANIAKIALPIAGGAVGGPAGAAAGSAAGSAMGGGGALGNLTRDLISGRDGFKSMGIDREKVNRVQELQTQRMFQSMAGTGESMLEPSVFYSNSVQFPYSLYDLSLRSALPRYEARIHISKTLYNNLLHNNNQNPITYPLNITFEKLAQILRPGFIQGTVYLDYDPNNKMTKAIAEGIHFYDDKRKYFVKPNLNLVPTQDDRIYLGLGIDSYTAQAITDQDEPWENNITRTKGSNFHQRAHFFIFYEDGSKDHWLVLFPQSFQDSDLTNGHTHGGFQITFDKPVAKMIDVYTCIGCGALGQGYTSLHAGYDSSGSDSLDTIHRGLPFDPWYNDFTGATLRGNYWETPSGKCLGQSNDVWEFTGQYIVGKDNKPFTEAYGFIPSGGTIQWTTKGMGSTKIIIQKQPGHDDFSGLDWTPPPGSGGDIEIPLEDPEITLPEPGEGDPSPEPDFPVDPFDPTGGEPEIPPIEPDLPPDIDPGPEVDPGQDSDPPPIEPDLPEPEVPDQDPGRDPEGDPDNPPDPFDPDDDPDGD